VGAVLKRHTGGATPSLDPLESARFFAIPAAACHPQEQRRMQSAVIAPSLMDNAEFYEELGKLEATPDDDTSEFPEPTPARGGVVQKPVVRARRPVAQARGEGPNFMMPPEPSKNAPIVAAAPTPFTPARPRAVPPALAVIGFVLLMLIGAGASALVFHDRVELIVGEWQSASR
jgi:hypothetical protein